MAPEKIKVGILGATGYTGEELLRLLAHHPNVEVTMLTSGQSAGKTWGHLFPDATHFRDIVLSKMNVEDCIRDTQVVFACLPHGQSASIVKSMTEHHHPIIDLAADFRLKDLKVYEQYYGAHAHAELLEQAVYGLPELWRSEIQGSKFVANPGCYPTSITLALAPLLKAELIDTTTIICDSKSGMSGAGRQTVEEVFHKEMPENFKAYKVIGHRHTPEIEQNLSRLAGNALHVSFTPHLLPVHRGILSTVYAKCLKNMKRAELTSLFKEFYQNEIFVKVLEDESPNLKAVQFTNECHLAVHINPNNQTLTILSAIDNLTKGASGQAIQNMNLMFGLEETAGLKD